MLCLCCLHLALVHCIWILPDVVIRRLVAADAALSLRSVSHTVRCLLLQARLGEAGSVRVLPRQVEGLQAEGAGATVTCSPRRQQELDVQSLALVVQRL